VEIADIPCAASVHQDVQSGQAFYTVCFWVRNNLMNIKVTRVNQDEAQWLSG
jgi:hypothetical protein